MVSVTISETIAFLIKKLSTVSETPHIDAEVLIMEVLHQSREFILTYPETALSDKEYQKILELLKRREQGEPIAYITGHKEFWSLDLAVNSHVLIPRPETEHLIEWVLQNFSTNPIMNVADLGVGSGAIAIALGHEFPQWLIDATDNNELALNLAQHNADKYSLKNIHFYLGNWCEPLPRHDYQIILSNPPYIDHNDPVLEKLTLYEPREALDGGKNGLGAIQMIVEQSKSYLKNGGYLVLEHGFDQATKVSQLLQNSGFQHIQTHQDLAGLDRFTSSVWEEF